MAATTSFFSSRKPSSSASPRTKSAFFSASLSCALWPAAGACSPSLGLFFYPFGLPISKPPLLLLLGCLCDATHDGVCGEPFDVIRPGERIAAAGRNPEWCLGFVAVQPDQPHVSRGGRPVGIPPALAEVHTFSKERDQR